MSTTEDLKKEKKEVIALIKMAQEISEETRTPLPTVLKAISMNSGFHRHIPPELVSSLVTQITASMKASTQPFTDDDVPFTNEDFSNPFQPV